MLLCNKKRSESQSQNSISKKDQHIFKPFFMPLIVFIKTVGISQKNITNSTWYLYWQKIYTHCAICRVPPMIHIIMRPIVLFYVLWQQKKNQCFKITETRPKKSFFLLFVVFIQLPMVCVTFSEKSYSVPIHTCAHSKSPPCPP